MPPKPDARPGAMLQLFFGGGLVEEPAVDDAELAAVASEATHALQSYSRLARPPSALGSIFEHFDALHVPA